MKKHLGIRALILIPVLLAGLLVLADAKPAHARPCFTDLADCYVGAAAIESFWYRWARGLDCELDFSSCLREALQGY